MNAEKSCPVCGKPVIHLFRPFCSQRCANRDLGHWLTDRYAIPVAETENDEALPDEGTE